jgi:hypothetical protein
MISDVNLHVYHFTLNVGDVLIVHDGGKLFERITYCFCTVFSYWLFAFLVLARRQNGWRATINCTQFVTYINSSSALLPNPLLMLDISYSLLQCNQKVYCFCKIIILSYNEFWKRSNWIHKQQQCSHKGKTKQYLGQYETKLENENYSLLTCILLFWWSFRFWEIEILYTK